MNWEETKIEIEQSYRFFLSELESTGEEELGYLVELMRAAHHILEIRKLFVALDPDRVPEEERDKFVVSHDGLFTLTFNFAAAQLREALKLFAEYMSKEYYRVLKSVLPEPKNLNELELLVGEWNAKKGFLYEILKPLRDSVFHYVPDAAAEWAKHIKEEESQRKPHVQSITPELYRFGTGSDYDKDLFNTYLFLGLEEGRRRILHNLVEVQKTQSTFLDAVRGLIEAKLKREGITKRPYDWHLIHSHGYKKQI